MTIQIPIRTASLLAPALAMLAACSGKDEKKDPPPLVQVARPVQSTVNDWDEATGRFVSIDAVEVRPRVTGYVTSVGFRDGQMVRKGQVLFQIDPRPYEARLAQARAQISRAAATLATAEVELRRARALLAAEATSEQEVQSRLLDQRQASADLAAARAMARSAALDVSFTRVRAAVSGRISDRRVNPGNLVNADQSVLTSIVTLDPIRFSFDLPESIYGSLVREAQGGRGAPVQVQLQSESGYPHSGKVEFIDNQLDTSSGTMRGRAVLPNPEGLLVPGRFGRMRLAGGEPYEAVLVPDTAISQDQDRQIVYTVGKDGKVRQSKVETGPRIGSWRVVRSGVKMGAAVIVSGQQKAESGQKVRVRWVSPKPPAPGTSGSDAKAPANRSLPEPAAGIVVGGA